jgi:hypothetical protein
MGKQKSILITGAGGPIRRIIDFDGGRSVHPGW